MSRVPATLRHSLQIYSQEALKLLQSVKDDALQVADEVTELKDLANDHDVDRGIQALALARIQSKVNDIKKGFFELHDPIRYHRLGAQGDRRSGP